MLDIVKNLEWAYAKRNDAYNLIILSYQNKILGRNLSHTIGVLCYSTNQQANETDNIKNVAKRFLFVFLLKVNPNQARKKPW